MSEEHTFNKDLIQTLSFVNLTDDDNTNLVFVSNVPLEYSLSFKLQIGSLIEEVNGKRVLLDELSMVSFNEHQKDIRIKYIWKPDLYVKLSSKLANNDRNDSSNHIVQWLRSHKTKNKYSLYQQIVLAIEMMMKYGVDNDEMGFQLCLNNLPQNLDTSSRSDLYSTWDPKSSNGSGDNMVKSMSMVQLIDCLNDLQTNTAKITSGLQTSSIRKLVNELTPRELSILADIKSGQINIVTNQLSDNALDRLCLTWIDQNCQINTNLAHLNEIINILEQHGICLSCEDILIFTDGIRSIESMGFEKVRMFGQFEFIDFECRIIHAENPKDEKYFVQYNDVEWRLLSNEVDLKFAANIVKEIERSCSLKDDISDQECANHRWSFEDYHLGDDRFAKVTEDTLLWHGALNISTDSYCDLLFFGNLAYLARIGTGDRLIQSICFENTSN